MQIVKEDTEHHVDKIKKEGNSGNYRLTWDKKGVNSFIIISNSKKNGVLINNNDNLCSLLDEISDNLVDNYSLTLGDTTFFYTDFANLMRNGGINIQEKPGYYAVYGCDVEDGIIKTVYVNSEKEKTISISVDIKINTEKVYLEEKKLFKKKERKYSGYQKISILNGIKGISEYSVKYTVCNGKYSFPIPKEVLENGGVFYIRSNENEEIHFTSDDKIRTI